MHFVNLSDFDQESISFFSLPHRHFVSTLCSRIYLYREHIHSLLSTRAFQSATYVVDFLSFSSNHTHFVICARFQKFMYNAVGSLFKRYIPMYQYVCILSEQGVYNVSLLKSSEYAQCGWVVSDLGDHYLSFGLGFSCHRELRSTLRNSC